MRKLYIFVGILAFLGAWFSNNTGMGLFTTLILAFAGLMFILITIFGS